VRRPIALALFIVAACTTTREVHVPVTYEEKPDASKPVVTDDDDDTEAIPGVDAGKDTGASEASTGHTPIRKTNAVVTIEGVTRTLERAQFGLDANGTFHIEAHEGGDPKCPDQTSPSPKRTLILTGVKHAAPGTKESKADGVNASFLDFVGDQLPEGTPFTKATAITVEIVAIKGAAGAETEVELEVDATFAEGTVKGRVFAELCQSLSE
jgi:hypothetical protein